MPKTDLDKYLTVIHPSMPPEVIEEVAKINSRTALALIAERNRQIALVGLILIAIIITGGSMYLSVLNLNTPEFLGVVFGSVVTAMSGGLILEHGKSRGRQEILERDQ